ncbi:MAG: hypothetical protein QOJ51_2623 [Acidobacteriaceae bacterium]|jgi:hypothetical protein|nr:hypothetical protein [Acidobacteriaceae bacterium]
MLELYSDFPALWAIGDPGIGHPPDKYQGNRYPLAGYVMRGAAPRFFSLLRLTATWHADSSGVAFGGRASARSGTK